MKAVPYSNARKILRTLIQSVCNNGEPTIIVDRQNEEQAVLISLADFQAMEDLRRFFILKMASANPKD